LKKIQQAQQAGGGKGAASEAGKQLGAEGAKRGAEYLTGGISSRVPILNKAIEKAGEKGGKAAVAGVMAAASAFVLILLVSLVAGVSGLVSGSLASGGGLQGPDAPDADQCNSMPANWCTVAYNAQQSQSSGDNAVPWTLVAGIAKAQTDYGNTSPYDSIIRDPNRPVPSYLEAHFADLLQAPGTADSGSVDGGGSAGAAGNDYAEADNGVLASSPQDSVVDPWGEYNRECVSWVAWKVQENDGIKLSGLGSAYQWGGNAPKFGGVVNQTPTVGSVAWYSGGRAGHVAWVTAVQGQTISVSEYNYEIPGGYGTRTGLPWSTFTGYIHFPQKSVPAATTAPTSPAAAPAALLLSAPVAPAPSPDAASAATSTSGNVTARRAPAASPSSAGRPAQAPVLPGSSAVIDDVDDVHPTDVATSAAGASPEPTGSAPSAPGSAQPTPGATATGTAQCVLSDPSPAIGGGPGQGVGPYLLTPAAAAAMVAQGEDPQSPCDAGDYVAEQLGQATVDVDSAGVQTLDPTTPDTAAKYWQAVMTSSGIFVDPNASTPDCTTPETDAVLADVPALISSVWTCEMRAATTLDFVTGVTVGAAGSVSYQTESDRSTAMSELLAEAQTAAFAYSRDSVSTCVATTPVAGIFPLSAATATQYGDLNRCDIEDNILAAAKAVLAGEAIAPAQRPRSHGPFEPMLGGWANIPYVLGTQADSFDITGPPQPFTPDRYTGCTAALDNYLTDAAGPGSPFGALATATTRPRAAAVYTAWLAHLGQDPATEPLCGSAAPSQIDSVLTELAQTLAAAIPAPTPTPTPSSTASVAPAAPAAPAASSAATPNPAPPPAPTTPAAVYTAAALNGLSNWFSFGSAASAPTAAVVGTDSLIERLASVPHVLPAAPDDGTTPEFTALPWEGRATDWGIFYGGLVSPWDTFGQHTGSLANSLSGSSEAFSADGGSSAEAQLVIAAAEKWLGTPYSWGGGTLTGPSLGIDQGANTVGFDCSHFTRYAYNTVGITLGATTVPQYEDPAGTTITGGQSSWLPGDLLFYEDGGHVAMYIGNGQLIEAPHTGAFVQIVPVYGVPWKVIRLLQPDAVSAAGPATSAQISAWVTTATGVLYANGFPQGPNDVADIEIIIHGEDASGDPGAVNNWDSNAAAGDPSFGLMQTIPATFDSYALPGYTNKADPVSQIIAGARYATARYGSLDNVPGVIKVKAGLPYVGY
jgi:cell wall-associated NlpC family hydrolase/surface antigen